MQNTMKHLLSETSKWITESEFVNPNGFSLKEFYVGIFLYNECGFVDFT